MFFKKILKNRKLQKENALELIPLPLVEWELSDDGKIQLLVKRFQFSFLNNIFKRSTYFRIKLDDTGSQVWKLIDGKRNIHEIAVDLTNSKLPSKEGLEERVVFFITNLYRKDLIDFNN